jgi:hypothetical protein
MHTSSTADQNSTAKELGFHLKELQWDLKAIQDKVRVLRKAEATAPIQKLTYETNGIWAFVEHDAEHHAPRALELACQLFGDVNREVRVPSPS